MEGQIVGAAMMSEACLVDHKALIKPVPKVPQADLSIEVTAGLVEKTAGADFEQLASHVKKAYLVQVDETVEKPPECTAVLAVSGPLVETVLQKIEDYCPFQHIRKTYQRLQLAEKN